MCGVLQRMRYVQKRTISTFTIQQVNGMFYLLPMHIIQTVKKKNTKFSYSLFRKSYILFLFRLIFGRRIAFRSTPLSLSRSFGFCLFFLMYQTEELFGQNYISAFCLKAICGHVFCSIAANTYTQQVTHIQ